MKAYFGYVRVSTVKQGEKGSSLGEQRSAIEGYARRHGLVIAEWFEELETAAKQGRPVFTRMLKALEAGRARGVITHKIDRSARNLKDWAMLGDLIDRGIEMHFAHESIDLTSRGGRLSADIQAVVAADYIRNLRDEVRKGFYGRLKQGLYPLQAPIGYLDQGGGRPKTIDPVRGPLVRKAFELYATGDWSLDSLREELASRGLRTRAGAWVSRSGMSTLLNNPFYVGLIKIRKTGEPFQGIHEPLVEKALFDRVQGVLQGRTTHREQHRFRYQRLLRCALCGYGLIAELQKGHVYYRCHTRTCPMTAVRQENIDHALRELTSRIRLPDDELNLIEEDIDAALAHVKTSADDEKRGLSLSIAALGSRLGRLTDALIDGMLDRDMYLSRKEALLSERLALVGKLAQVDQGDGCRRQHVKKILELLKTLGNIVKLVADADLRDILKTTTSNLSATQKKLIVTWQKPFDALINSEGVYSGGPYRDEPRTSTARIRKVLVEYIQEGSPGKIKKRKRRAGQVRSRRLSPEPRSSQRPRNAA